jgi:hypothetical protein
VRIGWFQAHGYKLACVNPCSGDRNFFLNRVLIKDFAIFRKIHGAKV